MTITTPSRTRRRIIAATIAIVSIALVQQPLRTRPRWSPFSTRCSPSGTSTAATDPTLAGLNWLTMVHRPTSPSGTPTAPPAGTRLRLGRVVLPRYSDTRIVPPPSERSLPG